MDNPEMPFGGLVCPNCGKRLELRISFDGLDEKSGLYGLLSFLSDMQNKQ